MTQPDVIIIPFRSVSDGKTRLAPALDSGERSQISRQMLSNVVEASLDVRPVASVIVVTPDPDAIDLLNERQEDHLRTVWQPPEVIGLNGALIQATDLAIGEGARTIVVIPADLPLIRSQDIENLLRRDAAIVVAPDRHRQGTNGLMQRIDATRGQFDYHFGLGSFHAHLEEAHRLGLDAAVSVSLGTSFDLDTPTDLDDLREIRSGHHSLVQESVAHG